MVFESIDDVLAQLDAIIELGRKRNSTDAYFAALYRRVTAEVKAQIAAGAFEDGPRMARFDVIFASRYLNAWLAHERGEKTSAVWDVAFGCVGQYWPIVLQYLLVGMNAHINFDLGIAAAEVAPGQSINALKNDFDRINGILGGMVDDVENRLARIWPVMKLINQNERTVDDAVINFSIVRARQNAWLMATALASQPNPELRAIYSQVADATSTIIGRGILRPGIKLAFIVAMIRLRERGTVDQKLDILLK